MKRIHFHKQWIKTSAFLRVLVLLLAWSLASDGIALCQQVTPDAWAPRIGRAPTAIPPMPVPDPLAVRPGLVAPRRGDAPPCLTRDECLEVGALFTVTGIGGSAIGLWFLSRPSEGEGPDPFALFGDIIGWPMLALGVGITVKGVLLIRRGLRMERAEMQVGQLGPTRFGIRFQF